MRRVRAVGISKCQLAHKHKLFSFFIQPLVRLPVALVKLCSFFNQLFIMSDTAASSAPRRRLPGRSLPTPRLNKPFCLRCIKRMAREAEWDTDCVCRANRKCDYCVGQRKPCHKVSVRSPVAYPVLIFLDSKAIHSASQ